MDAGSRLLLAAIVVCVALVGVRQLTRRADGVNACRAVTGGQLADALGWSGRGPRAEVPEQNGPPGTTLCGYVDNRSGRASSSVTVFAIGEGGAFYAEMEDAAPATRHDISGSDYSGFAWGEPARDDSPDRVETFFLLKHGQYVNVLLRNFPPGSAERLAPVVAADLP